MESLAKREVEEALGSDLVTRKSKPIAHNAPTDFAGTVTTFLVDQDEEIVGMSQGNIKAENKRRLLVEDEHAQEEEEEEEEEGEYVNGKSHQGIFLGQNGGSTTERPGESSTMEHQVDSYLNLLKTNSDDYLENVKGYSETDHNNLEISRDEITNTIDSPTAKTSNGDHSAAVNGHTNGRTKQDESGGVITEEAELIPEYVERVIEKQETHDLFCPNCNSCITKRVILRPRKRKLRQISGGVDYPVQDPPSSAGEITQESTELEQSPVINENGSPPDVFRCLSCFSIFAQIGKSLKLFIKGDRGPETDENVVEPPPSNTPTSEATVTLSGVETAGINQVENQGVGGDQEPGPLKGQPELLQEQVREPLSEFSQEQGNKPLSLPSDEDNIALQKEPPLEGDGGNKITDAIEISGLAITENKVTEDSEQGIDVVVHSAKAPVHPGTSFQQTENSETEKPIGVLVTRDSQQTEVSVTIPANASPETETLLEPGTNTDALTASAAPVPARAAHVSHIDVIRAIVYGGLIESIASLSVVTSAAGAETKTLNILALGAANMFGGIFFLAHNLRVLKHETSEERYEEALGHPGHFTFHSVVAVVSYLLFGLIPPVVYGFSFRESDNRDYKLIAVGLASLLCIIMLSLGKAYARAPPKSYMKTLCYYLGLWVMVCGISYVAGRLIDLLLKKLALFGSSALAGDVGILKTQWASY